MRPAESAWCMKEFLGGRQQKAIAEELNVTPSCIGSALMKFYEAWGSSGQDFTHIFDYNERRDCYYSQALIFYLRQGGTLVQPTARSFAPIHSDNHPDTPYWLARREHVWLLRAEGLTLQKIADRMGLCKDRARQLIMGQGWRVARAMKHTKVRIEEGIR